MKVTDVLLLTSEYIDEDDGHEVRIYGKSSELGPVELIFDNAPPVFFVDREEKLPALDFEVTRKEVPLTTFRGRPVDGLYFTTYRDQRQAAERFAATGVRHYESDVRPPDRILMERFVYGSAKVAGEAEQNGNLTTFRNPKIKSGPSPVRPTVLSLDIETGVSVDTLFSIGLHLTGPHEEKKVLMLGEDREDHDEVLSIYPSEKALLEAFHDWFAEADPDIIIGWFVVGFDLCYLDRRCRELGMSLDLSRSDRPILLTEKPGAGWLASISGRVVIDGIPAVRGAGYTFPNYKLETVAQELLGTGKLIASDHNKVAEIERQFREDKPALARYNLEDCVLVTELFDKIDLIPLTLRRCFFSGLLPDQLNIPNAALDHYMLPKLHRKGLVAPNVPKNPMEAHLSGGAAHLSPGVYQDVAVLDFVNMVPSLVRIFKIDPLALVKSDENPVTLPNGRKVSGSEHLLPELFAKLTDRHTEAEQKGDPVTKRAIELQLKNFHKVMHARNNRFYQPAMLECLDAVESWLVARAKTFLEGKGYQVICADAETLFLGLGDGDKGAPDASAERIAGALRDFFVAELEETYGVSSIRAVPRTCFAQLVIDKAGEVKRYAGLTHGGKIESEGLDTVIKESTAMADQFREELVRQVLTGDDLEGWITGFVKQLEEGAFDEQLVFTKKIRKKVEEYAKNAPPHIRAARMLDKVGKEISYVWTLRGPVPTSLDHADIDYAHYIQKQIAPIADALLNPMGKSFDKLSQPEQISLF